ncbi:MAG: hypothetical protein HY309_08775, partial [Pseudomonas fluorescens]|nr:hypothetical protein [Pseudomonas fluorescens]
SYTLANHQDLSANDHLTETFTVTVTDDQNATTTQSVTISIQGTNDAPIAAADVGAVAEDATLTRTALTGVIQGAGGIDTDVDNTTASLVVSGAVAGAGTVTQGSGIATSLAGTYGHLTLAADGSYSYVADQNPADTLATGVTATDVFTYTVKDPGGLVSNTTTLTMTVTGINDAPILDASKTPVLAGVNTSIVAPSGAVGTLASSLVDFASPSGQVDNVTDPDSGASLGIALSGTSGTGTWYYSTNGGSSWSTVGTVSGSSALLLAADANTRVYYQSSTGGTQNITFREWDQTSGTAGSKVDTATNGGTTAFSTATDTANITVTATDTAAPMVTVTSTALGNAAGATSTVTFQFSEAVTGFDPSTADVSLTRSTLSNITQVDGDTWTATLTRTTTGAVKVDVVASSYMDLAGNLGGGGSFGPFPAGVAGEPINLALHDPLGDPSQVINITVGGMPADWVLSAGTNNGDGTWTVQTNDPASLTVTTPATYSGAMVLAINMTWTNADGSAGSAFVDSNVEAYVPGNPIFALSADDNLTGSSNADLFVFAQPITNDTIHSFDIAADKIDLIGF